MKRWLNLAWVFVGLLVLAGAMITLGENDSITSPGPDRYAPSGTRAFVELLKQKGIRVRVDNLAKPKLARDEVGIAFVASEVSDREKKLLQGLTKDGNTLALFAFSPQFALTEGETEALATGPGGIRKKVSVLDTKLPEGFTEMLPNDLTVPIWSTNGKDIISLSRSGKGRVLTIENGSMATNRFIGHNDNAWILLSTLTLIGADKGGVAIVGTSYGDTRQVGLLERIGPWLEAAWFQLIFVVIVIVTTLERRFGIPDQSRARQRSTRDLLNAVADTHERARDTVASLTAVIASSDRQVRSALKIPRDASENERDRLLPEALVSAFRNAKLGIEDPNTTPTQALDLAKNLESEVIHTVSHRRPTKPVA